MLSDLVLKNRSTRRFREEQKVTRETLTQLVDLARLSASGGNAQPLKYMLSCDPERNTAIFPCLGWAGYLKDWDGPAPGERPAAYVVILGDREIKGSFGMDAGIAAQSICLGSAEKGLGACMIGSITRDEFRKALDISERYEILLVIALGVPAEKVVIEETGPDGDIKYWRDADGVHHVPKRPLEKIILG